MTRFCKDCRHIRRPQFLDVPLSEAKCAAIRVTDPVTGTETLRFCSTARMSFAECGPEGLLFEPVPPRPAKPGSPLRYPSPLREQLTASLEMTLMHEQLTRTIEQLDEIEAGQC